MFIVPCFLLLIHGLFGGLRMVYGCVSLCMAFVHGIIHGFLVSCFSFVGSSLCFTVSCLWFLTSRLWFPVSCVRLLVSRSLGKYFLFMISFMAYCLLVLASVLLYLVSGFSDMVSCSLFLTTYFLFMVSGSLPMVSCFLIMDSCFLCRFLVPGFLACWLSVLVWLLTSGFWFLIPGFLFLVCQSLIIGSRFLGTAPRKLSHESVPMHHAKYQFSSKR